MGATGGETWELQVVTGGISCRLPIKIDWLEKLFHNIHHICDRKLPTYKHGNDLKPMCSHRICQETPFVFEIRIYIWYICLQQ